MKITNIEEYLTALDKIYDSASVRDMESFDAEMKKTKTTRKNNIEKVSRNIRALNTKIDKCREDIKQAKESLAKKKLSIEIKKLKTQKAGLIKKYGEHKNSIAFTQISNDAKVYACARPLIKKYLTEELLEKKAGFSFGNEEQAEYFPDIRGSETWDKAIHLRDYVSSYITQYPERVNGAKYFIGLHNNIKNTKDLLAAVDEYFKDLNAKNAKNIDKVSASREGIKLLCTYPESSLQAVELVSQDALKYEGSEMGHCVSSYWGSVQNGESKIYSIRDIKDTGQLFPHATIQVKDGKIKQIKGKANKMVRPAYISATRDFVLQILNAASNQNIIDNQDILEIEKSNIGFFKDKRGITQDIFALIDDDVIFDKVCLYAEDLMNFPLEKMHIKNLEIRGNMAQKSLDFIGRIKKIDNINLREVIYDQDVLDFSNNQYFSDKININFAKALKLERIILPKTLKSLTLSGYGFDNLKLLDLEKYKDRLPENLEKLSIISVGENTKTEAEEIFIDLKYLTSLKIFEFTEAPLANIGLPKSLEVLNLKKKGETPKHLLFDENAGVYKLDIKYEKALDLSEFSNLKELNLSSRHFEALKLPQSLEDLNMQDVFIKDGYVDIQNLQNLRRLNLSSAFVRSEMFAGNNPNLSEVNFTHVNMDGFTELNLDKMLSSFAEEKKFSNESATRDNIYIRSGHFHSLKSITFPSDMENLNLIGSRFASLETLDLSNYDKLKQANFAEVHLKNVKKMIFPKNIESVQLLMAHLDSIEEIDFSKCDKYNNFWFQLRSDVLGKIKKLKFGKAMKHIELDDKELNPEAIIELHKDTDKEFIKAMQAKHGNKVKIANSYDNQPVNAKIQRECR